MSNFGTKLRRNPIKPSSSAYVLACALSIVLRATPCSFTPRRCPSG